MYVRMYLQLCNQNRGFEGAYFVFAWRLLWDVVRKNDMNMKIFVCLIPEFANIWTLVLRMFENYISNSEITKFNLCFDLFGKREVTWACAKGQNKSLRVHMNSQKWK